MKDGQGRAYDTKEIIKAVKQVLDTDDGNYVRYDDLVKFAKAQGWTKGGGLPLANPAPTPQIAAIVAAVMQAMQAQPPPYCSWPPACQQMMSWPLRACRRPAHWPTRA